MPDRPKPTPDPHDRLTLIAETISKAADELPEMEGIRYILMLDDGKRGGIKLHGYGPDDMVEAMVDLFVHMRAVFNAGGKELSIAALQRNPRLQ